MTRIGPLNGLPVACTLTAVAGEAQVEKWRAFDADYALETERTDTRLTIRYAKVEDSIRRLRALVAAERACCAFVDWRIEETHPDLRLVVSGTPERLAVLDVGFVL